MMKSGGTWARLPLRASCSPWPAIWPSPASTSRRFMASPSRAEISYRTMDKHPRDVFHYLERPRKQYNVPTVKLAPCIDHLLYFVKKASLGGLAHIEVPCNHNIHKPARLHSYFEPLLFHTTLSLFMVQSPQTVTTAQRDVIEKAQACQLRSIASQHAIFADVASARLSQDEGVPNTITADIQHTLAPNLAAPSTKSNLNLLIDLLVLLSPHSAHNLVLWVRAIAAKSVASACEHLANRTNIPSFLLMDILSRTPMNKHEFCLQHQIWIEYQPVLLVEYKDKSRLYKQCLDALLLYALEYDPLAMLAILRAAFEENNKRFKNSVFDKPYLNSIIWKMLYNSRRAFHVPYAQPLEISVTKAQEAVVKQLSRQFANALKPHMNLQLQGYMGIVLAIQKMSNDKAMKLLQIAEQQYSPEAMSSKRDTQDLIPYHFTKISVTDSPDQLLYTFNNAADTLSHLAVVWFGFIAKLAEFDLLSEARCIKILEQLLAKGRGIIITKDILLRLLAPISSLRTMEQFLSKFEGKEHLLKGHKSTILPKYLRLLYNKAKEDRLNTYFRPTYIPSFVGKEFPKRFPFIEYARRVYDSIESKTATVVGIHLVGESHKQPDNIHDMYVKELAGRFPTEDCLTALLNASLVKASNGQCIQWGEMYAPQVTIHEFHQHVVANKQESSKLYPSDALWRRYIFMLSEYDYISELSKILQWWEDVEFEPSVECLLDLLVALPDGVGERHIKHYQVSGPARLLGNTSGVKAMVEWKWPTMEQLAEAKQRQKERAQQQK